MAKRIASPTKRTAKPKFTFRSFFKRPKSLPVVRAPDGSNRPGPMQWLPCHPSTLKRFKATMACPKGHLLTLGSHRITKAGSVSPSVICPAKGCSFHAYVKLRGWTFGLVR